MCFMFVNNRSKLIDKGLQEYIQIFMVIFYPLVFSKKFLFLLCITFTKLVLGGSNITFQCCLASFVQSRGSRPMVSVTFQQVFLLYDLYGCLPINGQQGVLQLVIFLLGVQCIKNVENPWFRVLFHPRVFPPPLSKLQAYYSGELD